MDLTPAGCQYNNTESKRCTTIEIRLYIDSKTLAIVVRNHGHLSLEITQ